MARRKAGTLLALEVEIIDVALSMLRAGQVTFHGFGLAHAMRAERASRSLTAHGTLYKALGRLEELGLISSDWEHVTAATGRPRRRLYQLSIDGVRFAEQSRRNTTEPTGRPVPEPA